MTRPAFLWTAALCLLLVGACMPDPPPLPAPQLIPEPDPAEVEHVVFLVGDPGTVNEDYYPIVPRLQQDIEAWAERLQGDSAVSVLFLGDIVYPFGMHEPGSKLFPQDSAVVETQVRLLAGPRSRERQAQGYFLVGNHDWGLEREWEGFLRLKTLDGFLERARERTGAHVRLAPEAGTGGPYVVDVGTHLRLLLLDTAWWLLAGGKYAGDERDLVLRQIEEAMLGAGEREVMLVAHHPFESAGPHGGQFSLWDAFGARFLLAKSGAILQDLSSIPYRQLEHGLREIFARVGPPLAFIGGHEHSLQVLQAVQPTDPVFSIVSGSAAKLTQVSFEPGLRFARSMPGYMRLLVHRNGRMSLFVEATPPEFQTCPKKDPERQQCMAEGAGAFETIHSQMIR